MRISSLVLGGVVFSSACSSIEVHVAKRIHGTVLEPPKGVEKNGILSTIARENREVLDATYGCERLLDHLEGQQLPQMGLALSGGGLRSAAFCIGVLSALHDKAILEEVDCVSSVSGGGYAMSWFLLQQFYERNTTREFRDELSRRDGRFQKHLILHSRLLTKYDSGLMYYLNSFKWIGVSLTFAPINLLCNGLFPWHVNTVPMRLVYEDSIERTFHQRPIGNGEVGNGNDLFGLWDYGVVRQVGFEELGQFASEWHLPNFIVNTTCAIGDDYHHHASRLHNSIFEFTPFGFGSDAYGHVRQARPGASGEDAVEFPMTFNRAIAVSGAAADSSQSSTPAERVLNSGFNLDLGYHIPNYGRGSPFFDYLIPFPFYLWFGNSQADARGTDIYLTDGGHSDNLAAYSLIRRGCHNIVIVDAEHDPNYEFESYRRLKTAVREELGMVLSVPAIDRHLRRHGLLISDSESELEDPEALQAASAQRDADQMALGVTAADVEFSPSHPVSLGTVFHLPIANREGIEDLHINIQYVKLSMDKSTLDQARSPLPITSRRYARNHGSFPQEPTTDQNYGRAQFEAYRDLGAYIGKGIGHLPSPGPLAKDVDATARRSPARFTNLHSSRWATEDR